MSDTGSQVSGLLGSIVNWLTRRDTLKLAGGTVSGALLFSGSRVAATRLRDQRPALARITLTINGKLRELMIDSRQSLLDVLRERLDLTGTKKGCNQGACGACTILLDGKRVNSCLTLAVMHNCTEIVTIEGLAKNGELNPLQTAFIEEDGFQCGYCTAGQIMSGVACIAEGHAISPEEVKFWMSGNICRCGAYPGIVAAITKTAAG